MRNAPLPMHQLLLGTVLFLAPFVRASNVEEAGARVVKLYGAGGLGRVEAYGSGLIVSPVGHVLTVLGPMLDTEQPRVLLADGETKLAKVVARDPARELAMLKFDANDLPFWDFERADAVGGRVRLESIDAGTTVYAWSNLFGVAAGDEPLSLQRGVISTMAELRARQGIRRFAVPGKVYVLDAVTNNPGSAGGAIVLADGSLVGMIGKELRNSESNTWINHAIPAMELKAFVLAAISGKEIPAAGTEGNDPRIGAKKRAVDLRGVKTLPEILDRIPPYVDGVEPDSPAAKAGLREDDLILFVNDTQVKTLDELKDSFAANDPESPVRITVLRGEELMTFELPGHAPPGGAP